MNRAATHTLVIKGPKRTDIVEVDAAHADTAIVYAYKMGLDVSERRFLKGATWFFVRRSEPRQVAKLVRETEWSISQGIGSFHKDIMKKLRTGVPLTDTERNYMKGRM